MFRPDIIPPPPIVGELEAIFKALPDEELLIQLRGPKRRGRPGYAPRILWRCYLTCYALGIESVSALCRLLRNNHAIAQVCGITGPIPSQPTMSRFASKLARRAITTAVREVQRELTRVLYQRLPDFGAVTVMDGSHMKAWSNAGKKGKRTRRPSRRGYRTRRGKVSDGDASWCVKTNTQGNKQFTWGYKCHLLVDGVHELPLVVDVTTGSTHDVRKARALLREGRSSYRPFMPKYVVADSGYSSEKLRRHIKRQYRATPMIDANRSHKQAWERQRQIPDWQEIYNHRTSVERIFGRLKAFFRLDHIRVRGRQKVKLHVIMSVLALQSRAVAFPNHPRQCVLSVA